MTGVRTGPARLRAADAEAAFAAALQETGFVLDPAQAVAASRLRHLGAELCRSHRLSRHPRRGLYLWGPVGRGKTMLLDVFLRAAPGTTKRRVHFDEFHVHDPGDAAFLTRLLRTLQQHGTTVVATSSYPPEGLLPNPQHHHLILPALELLERQADVLGVAGTVDYRTTAPRGDGRTGFAAGAYVVPGDAAQLHDLALATPHRPSGGRSPAADAASLCRRPGTTSCGSTPAPCATSPPPRRITSRPCHSLPRLGHQRPPTPGRVQPGHAAALRHRRRRPLRPGRPADRAEPTSPHRRPRRRPGPRRPRPHRQPPGSPPAESPTRRCTRLDQLTTGRPCLSPAASS